MKSKITTTLATAIALLAFTLPATAEPPGIINHQGRIAVDGENFDGTGYFKFALVSPDITGTAPATADAVVNGGFVTAFTVTSIGAGYASSPTVTITGGGGSGATATANIQAGSVKTITVNSPGSGYTSVPSVSIAPPPIPDTTLWSHDGTSGAGSEPKDPIAVLVAAGHYAVPLGETGAIPAGIFANNSDIALRVWFSDSDTAGTFELLTPDRPLASAGFAFSAASIADGAVTADSIVARAITTDKIALGAVTEDSIVARAITTDKIALGAVTDKSLANGAVTTDKILKDAVVGSHIASGAVSGGQIANGSITQPKIAVGAVTGTRISSGAVVNSKIADGAVTGAKIADGAVTGSKITSDAVTEPKIADSAITGSKIAPDAINNTHIATGSVFSSDIADGTILHFDIADGTIRNEEIAFETITGRRIADGTISGADIEDGSLTGADIASGSIGAEDIDSTSIEPFTVLSNLRIFTPKIVGIGVGVPDPDVQLNVTATSTPVVAVFEKVTSGTQTLVVNTQFLARSTNNMQDGFGPAITFAIDDNTSDPETIGIITTGRDGADDIGEMLFAVVNAGGTPGAMRLDSSGNLSTSGAINPPSDRAKKENFDPIDPADVLAKVAAMPITQWNYIHDDTDTPHLGPVAQDFHAAFGLGADDKHIATVDADGIALAAIQALKAENDELRKTNAAILQRLDALEQQN